MRIVHKGPRYAVAAFIPIEDELMMAGFVPGTYGVVEPVADPRLARKITMAADARLIAADLAGRWSSVGYRLKAWDLFARAALEDDSDGD